jgi:flagellar motility protein MotE (MotC chaperone)
MSEVTNNTGDANPFDGNFPTLQQAASVKKKRPQSRRVNSVSNGLQVRSKSPSDTKTQDELDEARLTIEHLREDILKLNNTLATKNDEIEALQNNQENSTNSRWEEERQKLEEEKRSIEKQKVI